MEYRDATYSVETQNHLRRLLGELTSRAGWNDDPRVHALGDVVSRWDANGATAIEVPDDDALASRQAPTWRDTAVNAIDRRLEALSTSGADWALAEVEALREARAELTDGD